MEHVRPLRLPFRGTDRFEILDRLGEGGIGVVYEAIDRERGTRVALKTLRSTNAASLLLLKNEFRIVQGIRHPNLVELGELFEVDGKWFFTMELVPGTHLLEYVAPSGDGYDEARLRSCLAQLARGLEALHRENKVHRDVKPSNVRVTPEGRVVLLDFGIVSDLGDPLRATVGDEAIGTVSYMAPEQAESQPIGPAADWYAVGVILHRVLTGRMPFEGPPELVLLRKRSCEPIPPRHVNPRAPKDLDALCVALLHRDPERRPSGAEILAALAPESAREDLEAKAPRSIFVGRRDELTILADAYRAAEDKAVTVLVEGESGVGKSFLVQRFAAQFAEDPHVALLGGRCYEAESVPFKGVDGIIDGLAGVLAQLSEADRASLLPPGAHLLGRVFPVLSDLVDERPSSAAAIVDPQQLRARVFEVLRASLRRLAKRVRVVLTIDDLQWGDGDSFAFLAELMRPPHAPHVLLIVTARSLTAANVARMPGDVRRVSVRPLPLDDARVLATRLLGDAELGRVFAKDACGTFAEERDLHSPAANSGQLFSREIDGDAIAAEANGHPLFIAELVRRRREPAQSSPQRLDDALWSRVTRLDARARELLEIVVVAGHPIAQRAAADAAGIAEAELFSIVGALRDAHLVKTRGVHGSDSIEPYHDRVRESVVAHLDEATIRRVHARLATVLSEGGAIDEESLAVHFRGAGDVARAAEYSVRAGDHAMASLAFDRAARLYRLAAELLPERARALQYQRAEALSNARRGVEAARLNLELAEGAEPIEALDLRRRAAEQLMCSGLHDEGVEVLRRVLGDASIAFPGSRALTMLFLIVYRTILRLRGLAFVPRDPKSIERRALVRVDCARAAGSGFAMSDTVRGAYFQARNLLLTLRSGDPNRVIRAMTMEIIFIATRGPSTRARVEAMLVTARSLARALGTPEAEAMTLAAEGFATFYDERFETGRALLSRAEMLFRDRCVGVAFELNSTRVIHFRALAYRGLLGELSERVPPVVAEVEDQGDRYSTISLRATAASLVGLASDDPDRVRSMLVEAEGWLAKSTFILQHYYCLVAQANLELYVGDAEAAHRRVTRVWPALRRSMLMRVHVVGVASHDLRARCAVAAAATKSASERGSMVRCAERSAAALEAMGSPWSKACALSVRAALSRLQGDDDAAIELLEATSRAFAGLDMQLHQATATRRRGKLLGGDEGGALVSAAEAAMRAEQIVDPRKMARMIAPGFTG